MWLAPQVVAEDWVEVRMDSFAMLGPTCLDFDGDGTLDIVGLLRPDMVAVRSGAVLGFPDRLEVPVDLPVGEEAPAFVMFRDIDNDNRVDMVGVDSELSTVFVMRGTSNGYGFDTNAVYSTDSADASALTVVHVEGDEMDRVVLAHGDANDAVLSVLAVRADPELRLEQVGEIDLPIAPTKLGGGDLDADGNTDILISRLPAEQILVYSVENEDLISLDLERVVVDFAVVDLNGDSRSDLAVVRSEPSVLEVFWNLGGGELSNGIPP